MSIYWIFGSFSSLLLILEILLGSGFFLFFLSCAGFSASLIGYALGLSIQLVVVLYGVLAVGFIGLWIVLFPKNTINHEDVNHVLIELKGSIAPLLHPTRQGVSKIKIRHTLWSVDFANTSTNYAAGTLVEVIDARGMSLIVKKVDSTF